MMILIFESNCLSFIKIVDNIIDVCFSRSNSINLFDNKRSLEGISGQKIKTENKLAKQITEK